METKIVCIYILLGILKDILRWKYYSIKKEIISNYEENKLYSELCNR